MKLSKIVLSSFLTLSLFSSFALASTDKDRELFEFSATPPVGIIEAPKVAEVVKPVDKKENEVKTDTKTDTKIDLKLDETPAALVADAETLIKDKLVQKYQVRLDEVIGRMTSRLSSVSPEEQRVALTDLRDRMSERKSVVLDRKTLEPLKRDIILAILDHVIYRLEGLIKQSAQTVTDKVQA